MRGRLVAYTDFSRRCDCCRTLFILRSRDFYFNYNRILLCRYNRCIFRESGRRGEKNGRAWPINFAGIYSLTILCCSVIFFFHCPNSSSTEAAMRQFEHKKYIHKILYKLRAYAAGCISIVSRYVFRVNNNIIIIFIGLYTSPPEKSFSINNNRRYYIIHITRIQ